MVVNLYKFYKTLEERGELHTAVKCGAISCIQLAQYRTYQLYLINRKKAGTNSEAYMKTAIAKKVSDATVRRIRQIMER